MDIILLISMTLIKRFGEGLVIYLLENEMNKTFYKKQKVKTPQTPIVSYISMKNVKN